MRRGDFSWKNLLCPPSLTERFRIYTLHGKRAHFARAKCESYWIFIPNKATFSLPAHLALLVQVMDVGHAAVSNSEVVNLG